MILTAHIVLLLLFVTVTTVLMAGAVVNRMRIQPVRMMWYRNGIRSGLGWSTVFVVIFLAAVVYAGLKENSFYLFLGIGYLVGGICWSIAMRLTSATIVTDFVVIRDMKSCGNVLCWNQVIDYFVHDRGKSLQYTFLYVNQEGTHARFDVQVPHTYKRVFNRMVFRCVEKKKASLSEEAYG